MSTRSLNSDIPWKRIFAEGIAIVVSILLAFAIDAWWQDRNERIRTEELLSALETEWSTELDRIDERIQQYDRAMAAMIEIIDLHQRFGTDASPPDPVGLIRDRGTWQTYKPSVAAVEVILDHGLDRIKDRALRMAIAAWPSDLDEIAPEQDALHRLSMIEAREATSRLALESGLLWERVADESRVQDGRSEDMALAMIRDRETIIVQRQILNVLTQYTQELADVGKILETNLDLLRAR
jgi:hypothetical protein